MSNQPTTGVHAAFDILLEEIETEIELANRVAAQALDEKAYDRTRELIDRAEWMTEFRARTIALRSDWSQHEVQYTTEEEEAGAAERRSLPRAGHGQRTPEPFFYRHILAVLAQNGGSGLAREVVDKVGEIVRPSLNDVDFEPVSSDPNRPRWRNTTHWARNSMVQQGLLRDDSPHGTWEITDKGRQYLAEHGE